MNFFQEPLIVNRSTWTSDPSVYVFPYALTIIGFIFLPATQWDSRCNARINRRGLDRGEVLSLSSAVWTSHRADRNDPLNRSCPCRVDHPSFTPRTTAVVPTPPCLISVVAVTSSAGERGRRTVNLQEKGRMSLKDGKKGDGDEREDSGREWRQARGVAKRWW